VVARAGGAWEAPWDGSAGARTVGPLVVSVAEPGDAGWVEWSVANASDRVVGVERVALVFRVVGAAEPVRLFRHGYQSWSPTGLATFGVDDDPSRADGAAAFVIDMHNADPVPAAAGELRSELVTVLGDASGVAALAGFAGGWEHDGTFWLRASPDGGVELWAEAYFGGAEIAPGDARALHDLAVRAGDRAGPLLETWAADVGARAAARGDAPYQVGWCSWYHYFHGVTESDIRSNLARAGDFPFDVFQIDDGYQADIGDWLVTNEKFPSSVDALAGDIGSAGFTPGIWLAPFLAGPQSAVATSHPSWLPRHESGRPLMGMFNKGWGGVVHALDTTEPEVVAHLEATAAALVAAGYPYLKLDFTYAPGLAGTFHDRSRTPAQRVRAGFEAIRRGAGPSAFLLGCGAPLGAAIGMVDGMRIGPDVAPYWHLMARGGPTTGFEDGEPATVNAWRNTLTRAFQHRRLWLNDPDCLMLRTERTQLTPEAVRAWALAVGVSGGMALVSDDLALLDDDARALLDEVLAIGRTADAAAAATGGRPARCADLMDAYTPGRFASAGAALTVDPSPPSIRAYSATARP
jgi:alpha-galactosidase